MIKAILLLSILSQAALCASTCKEKIIKFHEVIGAKLGFEDFSSISDFEEIGLSTEDFNALETKEQKIYFDKLMPVSMKAKKTIELINYFEDELRSAIMEVYLSNLTEADKLEAMKNIYSKFEALGNFRIQIEPCTKNENSEATKTSLFIFPELIF